MLQTFMLYHPHSQRSYGARIASTIKNGEVKNLQRSLDRYMSVQEMCLIVLNQKTFAVVQKGGKNERNRMRMAFVFGRIYLM